jgi:hypothetical protein
MKFKSVKLSFGNKEYLSTKDKIVNDLKPSEFIDFDNENFIIKIKDIDDRYNPYFYTMKIVNTIN